MFLYWWKSALVSGACYDGGAIYWCFIGAQMVVKGGTKFIRPVIVVMCFAMLIKYVFFLNNFYL